MSADGTGDFHTVQGAVDAIPADGAHRVTVFIKRGRYEEIVYFRNKRDITFAGEDRDGVVICYANNERFNGPPPGVRTNELPGTFPYRRAVFHADRSTGIEIENLTIENLTPFGGSQAEALLLSGGRNAVRRVTLRSHQDTVQFNDSVYVEDSFIAGDVDFVWGRGPAFFRNTVLRQLSAGPFMWVRSTSASHGFVFDRCRFETTPGRSTVPRAEHRELPGQRDRARSTAHSATSTRWRGSCPPTRDASGISSSRAGGLRTAHRRTSRGGTLPRANSLPRATRRVGRELSRSGVRVGGMEPEEGIGRIRPCRAGIQLVQEATSEGQVWVRGARNAHLTVTGPKYLSSQASVS